MKRLTRRQFLKLVAKTAPALVVSAKEIVSSSPSQPKMTLDRYGGESPFARYWNTATNQNAQAEYTEDDFLFMAQTGLPVKDPDYGNLSVRMGLLSAAVEADRGVFVGSSFVR